MNVDLLFQMAANSMTANMKGSNAQTNYSNIATNYSSNSNGQLSFKNEMDKAFDRKNSIFTQSTDKQETDNFQAKNKEDQFEGQDTEATVEQQGLAAALAQAQSIVQENEIVNVVQGGMKPTTVSEPLQLLIGQGEQKQTNPLMEGTLQGTEKNAEGKIQLPFQNNVDTVKAALLKEATEQQTGTLNQVSAAMTEKPETTAPSKTIEMETLTTGSQEEPTDADVQELPLMAKPEILDLSKVNIKVADAPVNTTDTNAAEQLADKIIYKMSEGKQEFDLQLNPRELGKLNIKLTFENGNAQVLITCSNSKAQNVLAALTENIRGILETSTGANSTVHLQKEDMLERQYNQEHSNREGRSGQNSKQQEKDQTIDELSFIDKLRLGLSDSLEVAV